MTHFARMEREKKPIVHRWPSARSCSTPVILKGPRSVADVYLGTPPIELGLRDVAALGQAFKPFQARAEHRWDEGHG